MNSEKNVEGSVNQIMKRKHICAKMNSSQISLSSAPATCFSMLRKIFHDTKCIVRYTKES